MAVDDLMLFLPSGRISTLVGTWGTTTYAKGRARASYRPIHFYWTRYTNRRGTTQKIISVKRCFSINFEYYLQIENIVVEIIVIPIFIILLLIISGFSWMIMTSFRCVFLGR